VIFQLAPHMDNVTPINAVESDTRDFIVEISTRSDVFNSLVVYLKDKIVS